MFGSPNYVVAPPSENALKSMICCYYGLFPVYIMLGSSPLFIAIAWPVVVKPRASPKLTWKCFVLLLAYIAAAAVGLWTVVKAACFAAFRAVMLRDSWTLELKPLKRD